jgi:acyl-CoA thioester hydrolase
MSDHVNNYRLRVYYEDTDAVGIVYYANYLKFAERARSEWLRALGFEQTDLLAQNVALVVRHLEMDNTASGKLDDLFNVRSTVIELKRASLTFEQNITNQQQQLLCTLKVRIACINLSLAKPCAIPQDILGAFKRG